MHYVFQKKLSTIKSRLQNVKLVATINCNQSVKYILTIGHFESLSLEFSIAKLTFHIDSKIMNIYQHKD